MHHDSAWQGDAGFQSPSLNGHSNDGDGPCMEEEEEEEDGDHEYDGDGAFDGEVHICEEGDGDAISDDDDGVRPGEGDEDGLFSTNITHPSSEE